MESMFGVRIVRRNPGVGPKPKKKRQKKVLEASSPKEVSVVNEKEKPSNHEFHDGYISCNQISVTEIDDVKKSCNEHDKGGEFIMEGNGTKEEYEPEEEYEPAEHDPEGDGPAKHDPKEDGMSYHDKNEFVGVAIQEGDECESESEEDDVGEEEEGVDSLSVEDMGDVVEEIEYVVDEIESDKDDDMPRDEEEDEMVNPDDEECHEALNERHKKKMFEVFIGGLDKNATEGDIKKVFGKVGEVVDINLMMDPLTKKNKGFAFLQFATVEQANRAVTEFKNPVVNGKQCGVHPCIDNNTLFLGNICKTWTKRILEEKLKQFGVEKFEDLLLVEDTNNAGMNRGFAFLEFSSHSDAMNAYKRLQKRDVVLGFNRSAKVCFARPSTNSGDKIITEVNRVFLDGVPTSWDENHVREHLKKFGNIEKIELARYKPSAKRKDYGFVTFNSHDAAVACAEAINNSEVSEGDKKVNVNARLAQPFQRRWKHHIRGDFRLQQRPASRGVSKFKVCPTPRGILKHGTKKIRPHMESSGAHGFKRPIRYRDEQPSMAISGRSRPLSPPMRSYDKESSDSFYHKSSAKRYYGRQAELPSRDRRSAEYVSRVDKSYRNGYPSRGSGNFANPSRSVSHSQARSQYVDKMSEHRFARTPSSHYNGHAHDYESYSGLKRRHSELESIPPSFSDTQVRQPRARLDYGTGRSDSHYADDYGNRTGNSQPAYIASSRSLPSRTRNSQPAFIASSRSLPSRTGNSQPAYIASSRSLPSRESHGRYYNCQDIDCDGCSFGDADRGAMYSPSYGNDYICPAGVQSYLSVYSTHVSTVYRGPRPEPHMQVSSHRSAGTSYFEGGSLYSSHRSGSSSYFEGGDLDPAY